MRLYNQTKKNLSWSMGAATFACEAWGSVEIQDDLVPLVLSRGLPLDVAPVAPEQRAQAQIADAVEAGKSDALRALRDQAEDARAAERAARDEIARMSVELSEARERAKKAESAAEKLTGDLSRMKADKQAAEELLAAEGVRATDAETRAIRAEALLEDAKKPAEPTKQKIAKAG
jgi:chromosome segregation ATPase